MGDSMTDIELVRRVQQGDKSAFDLLVLKYQYRIVKLVSRYVREPADALDVTQVAPFEDLLFADEPDPEAGPVAVELGYRIAAEDAPAFLTAIEQMRAPRRRDGATLWRVYRDLGDPTRYVERFIVTRWADYLHQRARATLADHQIEAHVRTFLLEGESVTMQHYIAER